MHLMSLHSLDIFGIYNFRLTSSLTSSLIYTTSLKISKLEFFSICQEKKFHPLMQMMVHLPKHRKQGFFIIFLELHGYSLFDQ
jgi:hypothetical protein